MGTSVGTKINAFQSELARPTKQTEKTQILNRKNELILKLLAVLEQHAAGEAKIFGNESLSGPGKQKALRTLGTNGTVLALKWLRNVIKDMQEADRGYRARFFTIDSGIKDPAVRMPTFTYLWSKLDTLAQKDLITQFLQAAQRDNEVVMAAMLEHPLGAMVNEKVKSQALTERAKRLTPQQYEAFEDNAILLEYLVMVRDWIARWLFGEVGVEIQPIRDALGDEIADALTVQQTGIPSEAADASQTETQPVGASS
jgi:hypothetical protein